MKPSDIRNRLVQAKICIDSEISGCTEAEVREAERRLGFALPGVYRHFMLEMGKGAGGLFSDYDWTIDQLELVQIEAREVVGDMDLGPGFLDGAFVLMIHDRYEFKFLYLGSDDSPIHAFVEGVGIVGTWTSFWDFLMLPLSTIRLGGNEQAPRLWRE